MAKRYEGLGKGSWNLAHLRAPASSPPAARLPFDSSTGYSLRSACIVTEYFAITSGRSMKYVIRRKPSASHWVKNPLSAPYRPVSLVFVRGVILHAVSSTNRGGGLRSQGAAPRERSRPRRASCRPTRPTRTRAPRRRERGARSDRQTWDCANL